MCVLWALSAWPGWANISFTAFKTGSDHKVICAFASFAWNPLESQWATLRINTFGWHGCSGHLWGISKWMLGYQSSPIVSCHKLVGRSLSFMNKCVKQRPSMLARQCFNKIHHVVFSRNSGVLHSLNNFASKATGSIVNSAVLNSINARIFCYTNKDNSYHKWKGDKPCKLFGFVFNIQGFHLLNTMFKVLNNCVPDRFNIMHKVSVPAGNQRSLPHKPFTIFNKLYKTQFWTKVGGNWIVKVFLPLVTKPKHAIGDP